MPAPTLDINLLAQGGIETRPLSRFLRWVLTYGRYIIIGTQIIVLLAFFSRFKLDQDLSDLHEKIDEKVNIIQALSPTEVNTRALQYRLEILSKLENNRQLYLTVLKTLKDETPTGITINHLSLVQNSLSINGRAINNSKFSAFLKFIRKNDLFSQITLGEVSQNSLDGTINFQISLQIKPESPKKTVKTAFKIQ